MPQLTVTRDADVDGNRYYTVSNLHPVELGGHLVVIPPGAIQNRADANGVTARQAVALLLREHYARLRGVDLTTATSQTTLAGDV